MGSNILTNEIVDQRLIDQKRNIVREENFVKSTIPIWWRCTICNARFCRTSIDMFSAKHPVNCWECKYISYDQQIDKRLLEYKSFIKRIGHFQGHYILFEVECTRCNLKYSIYPHVLLVGDFPTISCDACSRILGRISNEEIDQELLDCNAPVKRIENIRTTKIKIKFLCLICNNTFIAAPDKVRNGHYHAPCSYKRGGKKLSEKHIERVALFLEHSNFNMVQKYTQMSAYYDFICYTCKGMWKTKLTIVMNSYTGCPNCNMLGVLNKDYFINNPDRQSAPCILYLIQFSYRNMVLLKVGITSRSISGRFNGYLSSYNIREINSYPVELFKAYKLEQHILSKFKIHQFIPEYLGFDGKTECFSNQQEIIDYFNILKI